MVKQFEDAPVKAKKPDKRDAIVEAARELFTSDGYETTTIAHVAKKAGVAVGTVYLYFKNKQEMLFAVKGNWEQQVIEAMADPEIHQMPFAERGYPMIKACFDVCARQTQLVQMMSLTPQTVGNIKDREFQNPVGLLTMVQQFLESGIAAGAFRPVDTEIAAVMIHGVVERSLHQCFEVDGGHNQERYITAIVDMFIHYIILGENNSRQNTN
jgi:AcrR family transcriptional regulator